MVSLESLHGAPGKDTHAGADFAAADLDNADIACAKPNIFRSLRRVRRGPIEQDGDATPLARERSIACGLFIILPRIGIGAAAQRFIVARIEEVVADHRRIDENWRLVGPRVEQLVEIEQAAAWIDGVAEQTVKPIRIEKFGVIPELT